MGMAVYSKDEKRRMKFKVSAIHKLCPSLLNNEFMTSSRIFICTPAHGVTSARNFLMHLEINVKTFHYLVLARIGAV